MNCGRSTLKAIQLPPVVVVVMSIGNNVVKSIKDMLLLSILKTE
jgi:hypothetical protein